MGSAINGDGSVRWDDFKVVARFLARNPGDWEMALFDWEKAYRQLGLHPSQRRFVCIMDFEGRIYIDF